MITDKVHLDYIPILNDLFSTLGLKGSIKPTSDGKMSEFVMTSKEGRIGIDVKKAMPLRYKPILETISYTHLLALNSGAEFKKNWLVLLADAIPPGAVEQILEFTKVHKIKVYVVLMDTLGNFVVIQNGKKLEEALTRPRSTLLAHWRTSKISREQTRKTALTFSSGQQWILKNLLLNGLEAKHWGEIQQAGLGRSTRLGKVTDLAQSACFQTLSALKDQGFLVPEARGEYRFRKLRELMTLWKVALIKQKKIEIYLEPARAGSTDEEWWRDFEETLSDHSMDEQFTISGGVAAKWYSAKITREFSVLFHLPSNQNTTLEKFLRSASLTSTEERTSIRLQLHANSRNEVGVLKFREKFNLPPFADLLQVALDSFGGRMRGDEQGEKIVSDLLASQWIAKGWSL
jgi:hypothetical protein